MVWRGGGSSKTTSKVVVAHKMGMNFPKTITYPVRLQFSSLYTMLSCRLAATCLHMLLDCPEAIAFNFVLLLGHMLLPEKKKVHPTFQCSQFVSAINTLQIVVVIPFQLVCVVNSIDASNVSSNYLPSKDSPTLFSSRSGTLLQTSTIVSRKRFIIISYNNVRGAQ